MEEATWATHHASREPSTNINRNRYIRYYTELCSARKVQPFPVQDPFDVACFLVKYCTDISSVASLSDALSAIRTEARESAHQVWGPVDEWFLKRTCRGLRKRFRAPVKRKRPMTLDILVEITKRVDLSNLRSLQLLAMGFVCHDACLRMKELLDLTWSDITWELGSSGLPVGVRINIKVSKSRYEEAAEEVAIPLYCVGGCPLSGVQLLWLYMTDARVLQKQAGNPEAFLFPSLREAAPVPGHEEAKKPAHQTGTKPTKPAAMARSTVERWFRRRLREAGFPAEQFSGHSFRAGGATDLHKGKVPEALAMRLGRWRCREVYFIYLREDDAEQALQIRTAFEASYKRQRTA